jgi:hypothetical protein
MVTGTLGFGTFAELWNGSTWTQTLSDTEEPPYSENLLNVSCVGTDCMATGFFLNVRTPEMLAEYWNGESWTTSLSGVPGNLRSLSCYTSQDCLVAAVGQPTAQAEFFDNGTWSSESPPSPYQYDAIGIGGCETATTPVTCMAVGGGNNTGNTAPEDRSPVAELWNASTQAWTITSPISATTSRGTPAGFSDAACTSATWCVAVGAQVTHPLSGGGAPDPLAEAWNGSNWIRMNTNYVSGALGNPSSGWTAVSCPSSTFCVAVGTKPGLSPGGPQPEVAFWGTVP